MFGFGNSHDDGPVLGPTVAGTWYPGNATALTGELDRLLAKAESSSDADGVAPGRVVALIAPHAGYAYSGAVAARGFRALPERGVDRVVLLGPSHYASFSGAALPTAHRYRTPLGEVAIDAAVVNDLASRPGWRTDDAPFLREHCLEAEIPFLQRVLEPGWQLVPVLIGYGSSSADLEQLADAVRPWIDGRTLVVVSSDMTHYGENFGYVPFREDIRTNLERLDRGAIAPMLASDVDGFRSYIERTRATVCGRRAIEVLLRVLPGACPAELLAYDTSGRMTGSWDHSVSYASVVYRQPDRPRDSESGTGPDSGR